jgi:hypothetical protein
VLLEELLPRWLGRLLGSRRLRRLAIRLGIRRITPADGEPRPRELVVLPDLDTGGVYRPSNRVQDPAIDPREPFGGEGSSRGNDHGWSGCTMSSGATALAYETGGRLAPWGGDLRHEQGDLEGGTDLYDLRTAWAAYGEELTIRSGAGWDAVRKAHDEGRAIVAQGTGEVPGSATFDGGHACVIGTETRSSDGAWLFGDPLVSSWQWASAGSIRSWMERWQSSCAFAVSRIVNPPPEPPDPKPPEPPEPPPVVLPPAPGYSAGYAAGTRDGHAAEADRTFASWLDPRAGGRWEAGKWSSSRWAARPVPLDAVWRAQLAAAWSSSEWTAATWRE